MATWRAPAPLTRPQSVTLAVAFSVLVIIANFATPLLPSGSGDDKVPTFVVVIGIMLAVLGIPAVIGLWQLRKWGFIATIVVSAINLLLSAPGIAGAPNAATKAISGVFTLVSAAIIVLAARPDARRAYR